jgi:hypothetical protein
VRSVASVLVRPGLDARIDREALAVTAAQHARPRALVAAARAHLGDRILERAPVFGRHEVEDGQVAHGRAVALDQAAIRVLDAQRVAVEDHERVRRLVERPREAHVQALDAPPRGDVAHEGEALVCAAGDEPHLELAAAASRLRGAAVAEVDREGDLLPPPRAQRAMHVLAHLVDGALAHACRHERDFRRDPTAAHQHLVREHVEALAAATEAVNAVGARAHQRRELGEQLRVAHEVAHAVHQCRVDQRAPHHVGRT